MNTQAPHTRLRVYPLAQQLAVNIHQLMDTLPHGNSDLRDQTRRAAHAVVRNLAEGAGRFAPADKRARYHIALGELAECEACLDTATMLGLVPQEDVQRLAHLASAVGRMLNGLARAQEQRMRK